MSTPQTAARAAVQQRCADAYLHDIRGSLQALFGAVELLCRVAKGAGDNPARADKACDLARRAVTQHEKTTLDLFRLLTFQPGGIEVQDLRTSVDEVVHLFRNDLAARGIVLRIAAQARPAVKAERGQLHAALAAVVSVAIDSSPAGSLLLVEIAEDAGRGVLTIQPDTADASAPPHPSTSAKPHPMALSGDMLLAAAAQFLTENGGKLDITGTPEPTRRTLRLTLPPL